MTKTPKKELTPKEASDAAKALEVVFAAGLIGKKKLYWENFVRGVTMSMGTIVGATIGIALLLWVLSLFQTTPLIGPLIRNATNTIDRSK